MKRLCIKVLLIVLIAVSVVGCNEKPYSSKEVENILQKQYGVQFTLISETQTSEYAYEYVFEDSNGISVTVKEMSSLGDYSLFRRRFMRENYLCQLIDYQLVENILLESDFEYKIYENERVYIYIDNHNDIKKAVELMINLLELQGELPFVKQLAEESKYPKIDLYNQNRMIISQDYWKGDSEKMKEEELYYIAEKNYVNEIKGEWIDEEISDELWLKYPALRIKDVFIQDQRINGNTYDFKYNEVLDTYLVSSLDICQDFEGFPYAYTSVGTFRYLVEFLGGTYHCDDWKATWEIGDDVWMAFLETGKNKKSSSKYGYVNMTITKNDKEIILSEGDEIIGNGTVSGRKFTIEDLEKILGVTIEVNQLDMEIRMNK